jgi:N6-adenosine-specific RNA methylase IME4
VVNPRDQRPTLASQGINKSLANRARTLRELSDDAYAEAVAQARATASRSTPRVINEVAISNERTAYRARTYQGGTVADLQALIASNQRFGVILGDPAWTFRTHSQRGKQRSPERHYDCLSIDEIAALPIASLAADNCVLFLWCVNPELAGALTVIKSWGFENPTVGFAWVKTTPSAERISLDGCGLHWGMGYHTRSNIELCLLATRGSPTRLATDVHQVIVAPVGEHSAKPDRAYRRIERLYPGPYLELFARRERPNWTTWGDEIFPASLGEVPSDAAA